MYATKEIMVMKLPAGRPFPFIVFYLDNQSERKTKALLWKIIKAYRTSKDSGKRMQIHALNRGEHGVNIIISPVVPATISIHPAKLILLEDGQRR